MRRVLRCLPALLLAGLPGLAHATEWLASPAMYPPDTWQGRTVAVVRVLDKLDAHVALLNVPVGQDMPYKSLTLHATSCLQRPATLPADSAAWLDVHDAHEGMAAFQGWMAVAEPATGVFQNPLYDVQLVGCAGDSVAPTPPPLAAVAVPTEATPGAPAAATPDGQPAPPQAGGVGATPVAPQPAPQPLSPPMPAMPSEPADEGAAPLMLH
ncbi:hypothetical protein B0W47_11480 [Komagataeibacter nataicola]|uniref:DUF2155 domain-containing protein n=1 Tax=Komagataeibacter nataicola TaxID=265960 RepID=A0A9N7H183_9PROT|nr:DUF2155 domain-containing protein [Komagataeibacter nataicola]AQU87989.1 hypothetical protein B0W47_11480 [Komagataeibacter nataicola]PYD65898.1 hypothetical protein CDI09_10985 [Komagataeibacter nataicola]WNM09971.1 DUF2155 domain-containing protein [Komagataeibacter nataicola]